jgi:NitT/TauT family transport system substrate-binding protein
VLTQKFYDEYRAFSNRFYRLVKQSIDLINKKPKTAAAILAREDQTEATTVQFTRWITRKKSLTFTTRPRGLMRTAGFMNRIGLLNKVPGSWRELVFPPVLPTKGS